MKKYRGFFIIVLLLLCFTHFYNDFTSNYDKYSEVLVIGKIIQLQNYGQSPGGFMGVYTEEWGDKENYALFLEEKNVQSVLFKTYTDAIGIHGSIWGYINLALYKFGLSAEYRLRTIYLLNETVGCIILAILIYSMKKRWGIYAAVGSLVSLLPFKYFFYSLYDLYWGIGIKLLPTAISCCCVFATKRFGEWKKRYYFYICGTMVFCLLHTFEFVTTEMLLCIIPLVLYWIDTGGNFEHFKYVFLTGISCLVGFVLSIFVYGIKLFYYFGRNYEKAISHITWILGSRSGLNLIEGEHISELGKDVSAFDVLKKYLWGDGSYIIASYNIKEIHVICLFVFVAFICFLILVKDKCKIDFSLVLLIVLAGIASVSWMVISQGHAYHHTFLIGVLWFTGLNPAMGCFLGKMIENVVGHFKNMKHSELRKI